MKRRIFKDLDHINNQKKNRLFVSHDFDSWNLIVLYDGQPGGTGVGDYPRNLVLGYKALTTQIVV